MTPFRWKVMGGFLALSVGGLAACADSASDQLEKPVPEPAPRHAATPETTLPPPVAAADPFKVPPAPGAPDTLPPIPQQQTGPSTSEFTVPLLPANPPTPRPMPVPAAIVPDGGTILTAGQQIVTGPEVLPRPRPLDGNPVPLASELPTSPVAPPQPPVPQGLPPLTPLTTAPTPPNSPLLPSTPPAPMVLTPNLPVPPQTPTPPPTVPSVTPPMAPSNAHPSVPDAAPNTPQACQAVAARTGDKLKMLVRLGSGTPRFEIRNPSGENLLLKVYGEKIEMKSSPEQANGSQLAGVSAVGKVRFNGPGVEGTCDQLAILSGTGEVLLQGNIHLKTKSGRTWSEISADKVIYQIGANGLTVSGSGSVRPASYRPQ